MDDAIAAVAVALLAVVVLRRLRRVVGASRRPPPGVPLPARVDRTLTALQVTARVAVAVIVLLGVAWLTRQLFT